MSHTGVAAKQRQPQKRYCCQINICQCNASAFWFAKSESVRPINQSWLQREIHEPDFTKLLKVHFVLFLCPLIRQEALSKLRPASSQELCVKPGCVKNGAAGHLTNFGFALFSPKCPLTPAWHHCHACNDDCWTCPFTNPYSKTTKIMQIWIELLERTWKKSAENGVIKSFLSRLTT